MTLTNLAHRFTAAIGSSGLLGTQAPPVLSLPGSPPSDSVNQRALYQTLRAYYEQNGLYDALTSLLKLNGVAAEALRGLRNPAFRVVEFHAGHLWPGTLPDALEIVAPDNAELDPAIRQVWEWSNWSAQKQVAARWLAIYGDLFMKCVQTEDRQRVYFQLVRPEHVTDFDTDPRGYITYIRVDVPVTARVNDKLVRLTSTEVWDKERFRMWRHDRGDAPLDQLGTPLREDALSIFGIDFVPFVHAPFRNLGDLRGVGSFTLQLDKIDEGNRQASRLYQLLFRNNAVSWALSAGGVDATGRPLPPPRIDNGASPNGTPNASAGTLVLGDDTLLSLPGNSTLTSLIPNLKYADALAILQDFLTELEKDLPELVYARVREQGQLSGRAVRLMLSDAVDRVLEVRGNAEAALVRADQMALTLGANAGLFPNIGTFEQGDFAHSFAPRDVLPADDLEEAQTDLAQAQAAKTWTEAGRPIEDYLRREANWSEEDLEQFGQARIDQIKREQMLAMDDMPPDSESGPGE